MPINTRKSHVKRCFGVIKSSSSITGYDDDFDTYLDILRTDEFLYQANSGGQAYRFLIKWTDDVHKEYEANYDNVSNVQGRKTLMGKATDPELPFEKDPEEFIPARVIEEMEIWDSDQKTRYIFKNKNVDDDGNPIPTSRKIDIIRIYHQKTIVDDDLNNPDDTHVVPDDRYLFIEDSQDKSQYDDMEVIKVWTHNLRDDGKPSNARNQVVNVNLHNKEIYEHFGIIIQDVISPGTNSSGDPVIAARMDPFQQILNLQWGGLAAEFGNKDNDP